MSSSKVLGSLCMAAIVALAACDDGSIEPVMFQDGTLSVFLTDAPGDVAAVWVDIAEVYFQGGPDGRFPVLSEPTGLVELTELQDRAVELVGGLEVAPGTYSQLRFVLSAAVLEATDGTVYAFGGAAHPDAEKVVTGELMCPSCSTSGLKVKLNNDALEIGEAGTGLVMDFDVAQSFGKPAGNSGKWVMKPVVHAVKMDDGVDPEMPGAGASISGSVALGVDGGGQPIVLPACPAETPRTIQDFVPTATAATLVDDADQPIMRSGEVGEDGTFSIDFLDADSYAMGFMSPLELGDMRLVFEATVDPATADIVGEADVMGVAYVITSAACEANPVAP